MAKKVSDTLAAELEALKTEVSIIAEDENASPDDITRSNTLLDEFETKKAAYDAALVREAQIETVMAASFKTRNTEKAGAPYVKRSVDPYETREELSRSVLNGNYFDNEDAIERARYANEQAPKYVSAASRERVEELLDGPKAELMARHILLTGSPEYHDEFKMFLRSKGQIVGDLMRTSMSLTDGNGGFLVPFTLDPTIILANAGVIDNLRSIATVRTIATDSWNGVSSAGVNAQWLTEGTAATDASPTFTQPSIPVHKAAAYVQGSYEVLQDSGFASELPRLIADAKARLEGAAFATGNTAASKPQGVIAGVAAVTTSIVGSATTGAFVIADVYATVDAVRARSQYKASFLANKKIYSKVRQFDTSGGGGFWANLGMDRPNELLSAPAYENSTMAGTVANAALVLLCGDFSQYYIIDRIGVSLQYNGMVYDQATGLPNGESGFFATWRVGAGVVDPDAFRLLQLNQTPAAVSLA